MRRTRVDSSREEGLLVNVSWQNELKSQPARSVATLSLVDTYFYNHRAIVRLHKTAPQNKRDFMKQLRHTKQKLGKNLLVNWY